LTREELRRALDALPDAALITLRVIELREVLIDLTREGMGAMTRITVATVPPLSAAPRMAARIVTWRERLWTCPPDTRLGVREVAEALGRPKSWVYRAVASARGVHRLPAARLNGELVFEAGAVREWIEREARPVE